jgi:hypothetical protein
MGNKTRRVSQRVAFRVLLIVAGLFILLVVAGFHPDDTVYFSEEPSIEVSHFLGRAGAGISAFLAFYIGRASYTLSLLMLFTGYCFFRKISLFKKSCISALCVVIVATSMVLFSLLNTELLYRGGGVLGRSIAEPMHQRRFVSISVFLLLFGGELFALAVLSFEGLLGKIGAAKEKKLTDVTGNLKGVEKANQVEILREGRRRNKPPLVRRVRFDAGGNIVSTDYEGGTPVEPGSEQFEEMESETEEVSLAEVVIPVNVQNSSELLKRSKGINVRERERETEKKSRELEKTLGHFGIEAKVIGVTQGPVITRYELQPAPGVKLSRIVSLSDNIALSLSAPGVRIEAPIPGRSAVGIEIPLVSREIVTLGDIIDDADKRGELPLILGKDIGGKVITHDLTTMPHLLIAGATGSGKSVCVNALIMSLLLQKTAQELQFIMIDPKMVELKLYNGIPHLLAEVVTDPRNAAKALRWVIYEMENRYQKLDQYYTRDIRGYNAKASEKLPYIVVIVDEFANLMAIAQKEVEDACVRLASMSRAVGIHLIMSTQRPSVDVITGLIKANFPYRIAFQVASKTDSRTILDFSGAEKLLGRGDMLFSPAGSMNITRIQGAFISEEELYSIVKRLKRGFSGEYDLDILSIENGDRLEIGEDDPMFDEAVDIILKTKRASASFLQRRLKIGYNRAARLIELMEEKGIIGPPRGSKPREIYVDSVD